MRRALLVTSMLLLLPLAGLAQPRGRDRAEESVTRYDENAFERETLEGTRRTPDGDRLVGRGRNRFPSLLHVRTNFWPLMLPWNVWPLSSRRPRNWCN